MSGRWRFASGCDHAGWIAVAARVTGRSVGPIPDVRSFLVPAASVRIEDTWFAAGLKGTGSKDVACEDVFVPTSRALSFLDLARGHAPGHAVNPSPLFRLPIIPLLALVMGGPALGLADEAIASFREHARRLSAHAEGAPALPGASPSRLAESMAEAGAAERVLASSIESLTRHAATGARLSQAQRARYLLDAAFVVASCTSAVDRLFAAGGAEALFAVSPLQRAFRDLHAMSAHSALRYGTATELFGRIELGLPPGSSLLLV